MENKSWDIISYEYREAAEEFAKKWEMNVSDHIIDIIKSVMMMRDGIVDGGSFVKAVCNNNLVDAVVRADLDCLANLKIITLSYSQSFVK